MFAFLRSTIFLFVILRRHLLKEDIWKNLLISLKILIVEKNLEIGYPWGRKVKTYILTTLAQPVHSLCGCIWYKMTHTQKKLLLFIFFGLFRATPGAYRGFQARGWIEAVAADLRHRHSNARSEPCLRPTPQLTATHWARPRIKFASSWMLVRSVFTELQWELQKKLLHQTDIFELHLPHGRPIF